MIEEIKYSEFFCNIDPRDIPSKPERGQKASPERKAFIDRELSRCLGGVLVEGVFFSGWLYWHLAHWWIIDDVEDEHQNIQRRKLHPSLRDNEWLVSVYLEQCRVEKKGYLHIGVRQFGKSEIMASYLAYNAILFEHTQNVIVGGNDNDLNLLKEKIDFGIRSLWEGIKIPKLTKDTKSNLIKLGIKNAANEDEVWSYLVIRNVSEGKKTEGPAGVTAKAFAIDEIGKFSFSQPYEASKPAFMSKFGWRCVPILFGTGGSFDKGLDAEGYFYHPDENNLLSVVDPETGEKTAIFMSGLYRIDCKYESTLYDFLLQNNKLDSNREYTDLKSIKMQVSDKEKALKLILQERKDIANDPDQTKYLKLVMYFPLSPKECFLSTADNFYNQEIARIKKEKLQVSAYKPMYVELSESEGKVIHSVSNKLPITSYPTKGKISLDTPICILEHPIPNPPYALYVAGIDPYRFATAKYSGSLGAVYIFKRVYDVLTDTFQDMFVAWYVGRPTNKDTWNNNARLLLKYYNAIGLCENDEMSFIDYMETKGEGHMLMDTPDWMREFAPTSATLARAKGVSRESERVRVLLRTNFKQYMEKPFISVPVPGSTETKTLSGVEKINDAVLLEEIEKWNPDGNFDREVAASLAITCAKYLDKMRAVVDTKGDDPRFKVKRNKQGAAAMRRKRLFVETNRDMFKKSTK